MGQFAYTALTEAGETVRGELEAGNRGEALRVLEERKMVPVDLEVGEGEAATAAVAKGQTRMKRAQLILF
ncbi:MAG: hypothetical protein P8J87_11420, partial [Verrucomicrobiales bacterium]|nr:hypothetical protein [Verrucomicrobiales bacterium]